MRNLLPKFVKVFFNHYILGFAGSDYQYIITEKKGEKGNVGVITLNRPKALNALCNDLMKEVGKAVEDFEKDESVGALVITGSEKAFAAGKEKHILNC